MATATKSGFQRLNGKGEVCLICGHKSGCMLGSDFILCLRQPDGAVKAVKGGMGWLHKYPASAGHADSKKKAPPPEPRLTTTQFKSILRDFKSSMTKRLLELASTELGVSSRSLERMGIGYCGATNAFSFPMFGGDRKPCGIRLRYRCSGEKGSVKGSRNGLFIPDDYDPKPIPFTNDEAPYCLVVPEGPTSTSAALDMGVMAIGRPSNKGGVVELCQLVRTTCPQDICVVADRDGFRTLKNGSVFFPGFEGALELVEQLLPIENAKTLRLIQSPKGVKDLRVWLKEGGTTGLLQKMLVDAAIVTPRWVSEQKNLVEKWRHRLSKQVQEKK